MLQALRERLSGHTIYQWPDCADKASVTQAVVWLPPDNFFTDLVNLQQVLPLAAGVDHLLQHPGLPDHIEILRLFDAGMGRKMAEYVLYGVLHAHRRMPTLQTAQRNQIWDNSVHTRSAESFHVGILGAGALGRQVAARLLENGYRVSCWSRTPAELPASIQNHTGPEGLPALLASADVLVCLLPLTNATRGILNKKTFAQLPRGAFLINAGRGNHLAEDDLLVAVQEGQLSGALLDVFSTEPLPAAHEFWTEPRIIITPHLAAPSPIYESVAQIGDNIERMERGEPPLGRVDRERGY